LEDAGISAATVAVQGYPYANPGKIDIFGDYTAPASTFPYYWLGNDDAIITTANWPDLVVTLRARPLKYGTATGSITITDADVSGGNSAVLTYSDAAEEHELATALAFGVSFYGTNFLTVTVPVGGVGGVTPGTWYITSIDKPNRTITISGTGWSNGTTGSLTVDINSYPHRVSDTEASPTTKARMFKTRGDGLRYTLLETYNGVGLTLSYAGVTTFSGSNGFLAVEKMADGVWVASGTLYINKNQIDAIGGVTINGITFADTGNVTYAGQSISGSFIDTNSDWNPVTDVSVGKNTGTITVKVAGTTAWNVGFVNLKGVALAGKPTWAIETKLPWLIPESGNAGEYKYVWGKTYTP
jgi:hypothetical protein